MANYSEDQGELLRQVRIALRDEDFPRAIHYLEQTVRLAHDNGDTSAEGRHLGNLALIYYRMQQPEKALRHFNRALVCAREQEDILTEGGLLGNIGNILREFERYSEAVRHLKQALAIANEIGDLRGQGIWLSNLGLVYDDTQESKQAVRCHRQAVEIARHLRDHRGLAARLKNLGKSELTAGNPGKALAALEEAAPLYEKLGEADEMAVTLGIIADVHGELTRTAEDEAAVQHHAAQAIEYYSNALDAAHHLGHVGLEAQLLRGIGTVLGNIGRYDRAIAYFQAAQELFQALGHTQSVEALQTNIETAARYRDQVAE
jgi:tetratricopeptide (TPR) repeat protein